MLVPFSNVEQAGQSFNVHKGGVGIDGQVENLQDACL